MNFTANGHQDTASNSAVAPVVASVVMFTFTALRGFAFRGPSSADLRERVCPPCSCF
jgi:hypothetical protein